MSTQTVTASTSTPFYPTIATYLSWYLACFRTGES